MASEDRAAACVFPRCVDGEKPPHCGHDCDRREQPYADEYGPPPSAVSTRPGKICDAASERALETSARLMEKYGETRRTHELLGQTTGVVSQSEYRLITRALDARADAFLEAANLVEFCFGVSRHPEPQGDG